MKDISNIKEKLYKCIESIHYEHGESIVYGGIYEILSIKKRNVGFNISFDEWQRDIKMLDDELNRGDTVYDNKYIRKKYRDIHDKYIITISPYFIKMKIEGSIQWFCFSSKEDIINEYKIDPTKNSMFSLVEEVLTFSDYFVDIEKLRNSSIDELLKE